MFASVIIFVVGIIYIAFGTKLEEREQAVSQSVVMPNEILNIEPINNEEYQAPIIELNAVNK